MIPVIRPPSVTSNAPTFASTIRLIGAVLRRLVLFSTLVLVAGGCGGSSPSSAPPAGGPAPTTTAPPVSPGATTTSEPPGLPTTPFKAKLVTDGPSPIVGKPWHFTV